MKEKILREFKESMAVKQKFVNENIETIIEVSKVMAETFSNGGKLILFGNGGRAGRTFGFLFYKN